ncbi:par-6 family cell polarity regulator gamma a isoform X2 [Brachyhypopomus gauderio]|uniref:par-6 family cell polarity regulator gamma a isoform X2 n=1 Tax=Brachyhypopomus gauderio TaxID=698409 RepID=UPI0040426945
MIRSFSKSVSLRCCSAIEFGAEFRRFSLDRYEPGVFEDFRQLILRLHHLYHTEVFISYADVHGELLPINNDDNFIKAVSTTQPLLRIFLQQREEVDHDNISSDGVTRRKKSAVRAGGDVSHRRSRIQIGAPQNFRPVSSVIDVDILPECHRRVRLYHQGSDRPLGFYIRDGTTVRVTPGGVEKALGIFISRMVPGGLAESTGLLAVNDQVLEVNGIDVKGKSLDQVTDMMVANSYNLIITVKPANQHNNVRTRSSVTSDPKHVIDFKDSLSYPGLPVIMGAYVWAANGYDSDSDSDLVIERAISQSLQRFSPQMTPRHSHQVQDQCRRHGPTYSTASCRSQPCLNHVGYPGPRSSLHREKTLQQQYRSSPALKQSSPELRQSSPTLKQSSTALRQSSSALRQSSPALRQSSTALRQSSSALKQSSPALRQSSPALKQSSPALKQSSTALKQSSIALKQSSPALRQSSPALKQSSPALKQSSPAIRQSSATLKQSSPALRQSSPVLKQSSTAFRQSSATLKQSSPAIRQISSSTHDILGSLHSDLRQQLMVPYGAMEEDGIVIIL